MRKLFMLLSFLMTNFVYFAQHNHDHAEHSHSKQLVNEQLSSTNEKYDISDFHRHEHGPVKQLPDQFTFNIEEHGYLLRNSINEAIDSDEFKEYVLQKSRVTLYNLNHNNPGLKNKIKNKAFNNILQRYSDKTVKTQLVNQYKLEVISELKHSFLKELEHGLDLSKKRNPLFGQQFNFRGPGDPCTNVDFEDGTFNGWETKHGRVNGNPFEIENTSNQNAPTRRLKIVDAGYNDGYVVPGSFPPVNPAGGGTYSALLGADHDNGYGAQSIAQTFLVDANNAVFSYSYALVLENPGGHTIGEMPFFKVNLYDDAGNIIPCGDYQVLSGPPSSGGDPDFVSSGVDGPGNDDLQVLDWKTTFAPLQAYIGQNVTIEFVVGDCDQGGHAGWAYIDMECKPMEIIKSTESICWGSPATLEAPEGAADYIWTKDGNPLPAFDGQQTITVTEGGNYEVTVIPQTGAACAISLATVLLEVSDIPTANFVDPGPFCPGDVASFTDLSVSSGTTPIDSWFWNFDNDSTSEETNPTVRFIQSGTYNVQLTVGIEGCLDDITVPVTVNPAPEPIATPSQPICSDEAPFQIEIENGFGGGVFSAPDCGTCVSSSGIFDPSQANIGQNRIEYKVTVAGCDGFEQIDIQVKEYLDPKFEYNDFCDTETDAQPFSFITGGAFSLVSGPAGTSVDPSTGAITPPTQGVYQVNYEIDNDGCVSDSTVEVEIFGITPFQLRDTLLCSSATGSLEYTAPSGYDSYTWNNDATRNTENVTVPIDQAFVTEVWVEVTQDACVFQTDRVTVEVIDGPDASFTIDPWCVSGGSVKPLPNPVNAGGVFEFNSNYPGMNISSTSGEVTPETEGLYDIRYILDNGTCADTVVQTVDFQDIDEVILRDTTFCAGDSVLLDAGIGFDSYEWNSDPSLNTQTQVVSQTGQYTVIVTDQLCSFTSNTITVDVQPFEDASFTYASYCLTNESATSPVPTNTGGVFSLSPQPSNGTTINSSTGELENVDAGVYNVQYWIDGMCPDSQLVQVVIDTISVTLVDLEICGSEDATLAPIYDYYDSYDWSTGSTDASIVVDSSYASNSITVTVTNGLCTITSNASSVTVKPSPVITVDSLYMNDGYQLLATGADLYTWTPSEGLSCTSCDDPVANPYQNTVYLVTGELDGCFASTTIEIEFKIDVIVPNVITPNGDGVNDFFYLDQPLLQAAKIRIYNRWGNFIYETDDWMTGWPGVNEQDILCKDGTYYYFIDIEFPDGQEPRTYTGTVYLKR